MCKICIKILTCNFTCVTYLKWLFFYWKNYFSANIYLFDHSTLNSSSGHDVHKQHVAEKLQSESKDQHDKP